MTGLQIKTFSNATGGFAAFKALGHPLAMDKARALIEKLKAGGPVAIYDPSGNGAEFAALYDLSGVDIASFYVQNFADLGLTMAGHAARPVTALGESGARTVLVCAFDAGPVVGAIRHLLPPGAQLLTFDELRLPDGFLTNKRHYLNTLNFATNFILFRDGKGHHSRMVTANYWSGYGAKDGWLWCRLFDADGHVLADWDERLHPGAHTITIDSAEIRARFGLPAFAGNLFVHAVNVAGHDIVKYALDTYGDDPAILSCTHDANAWPSALYAGLPAPADGEKVLLWIQNSHPCPIPAGTIGLNLMGSAVIVRLGHEIPPFGTYALDVAHLFPNAHWPQQFEIQAGMYFVRPRYEIIRANGRRRIAHANVERSDLKADPAIRDIGALMGKSYILPAPLLPTGRFRSIGLPTPMSTAQADLPLALLIYGSDGTQLLRHSVGILKRSDSRAFDAGALLKQHGIELNGFGHMEFIYDFAHGGGADGWLHGLFRYEDTETGHTAETSFGSHIFNTPLVFKNEPQSYAGKPPGLSTKLFLRLGPYGTDTLCHLIYAASTPWHAQSDTDLILYNRDGVEQVTKKVHIPCSGSLLWRASEIFDADEWGRAGDNAYIIIRDTTCRLFGYHGLVTGEAFSLDHMFGF